VYCVRVLIYRQEVGAGHSTILKLHGPPSIEVRMSFKLVEVSEARRLYGIEFAGNR